jgi:hypothetical protein
LRVPQFSVQIFHAGDITAVLLTRRQSPSDWSCPAAQALGAPKRL